MSESKLWQDVNALGGVPTDEYERGFSEAISQALDLIERSGHAEMLEALKDVRAEFRTEQTVDGEFAGVAYDIDALPRMVYLLDAAIAKAGGTDA